MGHGQEFHEARPGNDSRTAAPGRLSAPQSVTVPITPDLPARRLQVGAESVRRLGTGFPNSTGIARARWRGAGFSNMIAKRTEVSAKVDIAVRRQPAISRVVAGTAITFRGAGQAVANSREPSAGMRTSANTVPMRGQHIVNTRQHRAGTFPARNHRRSFARPHQCGGAEHTGLHHRPVPQYWG